MLNMALTMNAVTAALPSGLRFEAAIVGDVLVCNGRDKEREAFALPSVTWL